jgi:hypothetical protein
VNNELYESRERGDVQRLERRGEKRRGEGNLVFFPLLSHPIQYQLPDFHLFHFISFSFYPLLSSTLDTTILD